MASNESRSSSRKTTAARQATPPLVTHQQISERAYQLWEAKGRPDGNDLEHWAQAENELTSLQRSDAPWASLEKSAPLAAKTEMQVLDLNEPAPRRSSTALGPQ